MNEETARFLLQKVRSDFHIIAQDFSKTRQSSWPEFQYFLPYIHDRQKILDLGCGNGRLYPFLVKYFPHLFYTGLDISEKMIQEAKNMLQNRIESQHFCSSDKNAQFMVGDVLHLPFEDSSFDVLCSVAVLHHIPSSRFRIQALHEMYRVIAKNGYLIVTVWNLWQMRFFSCFFHSFIRCIRSFGDYGVRDLFVPWDNFIFRYYYAFTHLELRKLFSSSGFHIVEYHSPSKKVFSEKSSNNFIFICQKS